jgi:hypothetical protein
MEISVFSFMLAVFVPFSYKWLLVSSVQNLAAHFESLTCVIELVTLHAA